MNKVKLKKFEKIFNDEIFKINQASKSDIEIDISGDDVDKAQGDSIGAVAKQLSERNLFKIKAYEKALLKIHDGTFGECEECGEEIGEKRLLAKPDAEYCINCAEDIELLRKQFA